jgi:NAD(P)-dependent dehydrogenase (short-subunit alcohol dehydrogenase family)
MLLHFLNVSLLPHTYAEERHLYRVFLVERRVSEFGGDTPAGRPGQPDEVVPCYVLLASKERPCQRTRSADMPTGPRLLNPPVRGAGHWIALCRS